MEGVQPASIFPFCSSAAAEPQRKRLQDSSSAHLPEQDKALSGEVGKAKRKEAAPRLGDRVNPPSGDATLG